MATTAMSHDPVLPDQLVGNWVHAHEEDTATEKVYRPAGYPLPPSRGRDGFELSMDGSLVLTRPGSADRARNQIGRWRLREGGILVFSDPTGQEMREMGYVAAVDSERMLIRP